MPVRTVVIGRDTEYDYGKMQAIVEEMDRGTPVLATNPDVFHPGSRGEKVPETGSLYSPLEAITGKKVSYFGKPAPYMFELTMERCGVTRPEACVMVGDNLRTDIAGGRSAGLKTLWLSGMSGAAEEASDADTERPDYAIPDLLTLAVHGGWRPQ
jgi:HAD superfamily hydrolase (TIGR01450 family)